VKFWRNFSKLILKNRIAIQLLKYALIIFLVIFLGALGVLLIEFRGEGYNFYDAFWWALVTFTTVGFGDLYPITFWGRFIAMIVILLSLVLLAIFTAFIASSFIDVKLKERRGLSDIKEKKHILICGWNNSSKRILEFLNKMNPKNIPTVVLVNELAESELSAIQNNYSNLNLKFIRGDFTNRNILNKANVKEANHIILLYDESKPNSVPSDERTIIAAHNIAYLKTRGKISVQLKEEKYSSTLQRDRIRNVVIYDDVGGDILANSTLNPAVPDFIQETLKYADGKGFREINIPLEFINKTYDELFNFFKEKKDLVLLGITSVQPEFSIDNVLSDDSSSIDTFIKKQFELSNKKIKTEERKNLIQVKPDPSYIIQDTDKAIVL